MTQIFGTGQDVTHKQGQINLPPQSVIFFGFVKSCWIFRSKMLTCNENNYAAKKQQQMLELRKKQT